MLFPGVTAKKKSSSLRLRKRAKSRSRSKLRATTLSILALVMLINALSYGTIIPLLYPYATRFGMDPWQLSVLFASFSLAQFLATPVIGRLSDRFGRKPLLLLSLFGTSLSLAFFASAAVTWQLFVARILDGITGGNISVAQAMIADRATGNDRARAYGMLGASFGFGFLVGPALGGLMSTYGITAPFWFASSLALVGTILGWMVLPETLPKQAAREQRAEPLFRWKPILTSLFAPVVGVVFVISLMSAIAQNSWVIGFQAFTVDVLQLSARDIGLLFTLSGLVNIIMQLVGIRLLLYFFPHKRHILLWSLLLSSGVLFLTYFATSLTSFAVIILLYMVTFGPQMPLITAMLADRSENEDQGALLGINQSYLSLGQIIGPLLAGVISQVSVPLVFIFSGAVQLMALLAVGGLYTKKQKKFDL